MARHHHRDMGHRNYEYPVRPLGSRCHRQIAPTRPLADWQIGRFLETFQLRLNQKECYTGKCTHATAQTF